jgi:hypothetical protein
MITEQICYKTINTLSDKLMIKFNFMKETALNLHSAMLKTGFQKSHSLLQLTLLLGCEYHV